MAIKKGPVKQKTSATTADVLYPVTDADIVNYTNNIEGTPVSNVKEALDKVAEGIGVTGVKGNAETNYRKGNVNLTPANIGAIPSTEKGAANGVATLDSNSKVPISQLPDFIVGQMVYGGTVNNVGVATLTVNGKTKLGVTSSTINLPVNPTSVYEGIYFIADNTCNNSTIVGVTAVTVGDWLIVTNLTWKKIDNTDSVTSVNGLTGAVVLTGDNVTYSSGVSLKSKIDTVDGKIKVTNATVDTTGLTGNGVTGMTISNGQVHLTGTTAFATTSDLANKADKSTMTAGTYSAVTVNTQGIVTGGGQVLRVVPAGTIPTDLATNGWYFEELSPNPYNYSVGITFSDSHTTNRRYVKVYDGQDATGIERLNTTTTGNIPTNTYQCTSGYLFVEISTLGTGMTSTFSTNTLNIGVISNTSDVSTARYKIKVMSDGSITFTDDYGGIGGTISTLNFTGDATNVHCKVHVYNAQTPTGADLANFSVDTIEGTGMANVVSSGYLHVYINDNTTLNISNIVTTGSIGIYQQNQASVTFAVFGNGTISMNVSGQP